MELDNFDSAAVKLQPCLSMKILSMNNFTIKLLSDLSIGVHLKNNL